jgi:hypothetical protein
MKSITSKAILLAGSVLGANKVWLLRTIHGCRNLYQHNVGVWVAVRNSNELS